VGSKGKFHKLFLIGVLFSTTFVIPAFNSNSATGSDIAGTYNCAFDGEGNPTGVTFIIENDSGVMKIHSGSYCSGEIVIPQGVEEVSVSAFWGSGIEKVVIPASVKVIHESAFQGITTLTNVEFSNGDVEIGKSAFLGCTGLTSLNLKSGKKNIGETAFYSSGLTIINFGSGIESIGASAFVGTSLTSITFPSSLKSIGNDAFYNINTLTSVTFGGSEETLGTGSFKSTSLTSLVLPASLSLIPEDSFRDNFQLTSVKIPSGVITVDKYSFYGNYNLRDVDFGDTLQVIKERAFYAADLREVVFPNSLVEIETLAFSNNTNLKDVKLGFGLQIIRSAAFQTTDVRDLHIPASITTIEGDAFFASNLKNLSISESATGISQQAFTTVATGNPQYNANLHMCQLEQYLNWGEVQTALPSTFSTLIWVGRESTHLDSNGYTRLFFCDAPTAPKISTALASGPNSANVRLQQSMISGGSDISGIRIASTDGSFSQDFPNAGNATYQLSGLKPSTTYQFQAFSINAKGFSVASASSISITTSRIYSESEMLALQREAERLRQIQVTKSRNAILKNLASNEAPSLENLQKADFDGVSQENFARVQYQMSKKLEGREPSIQLIESAIKHVVVIDQVSKIGESDRKVYGRSLVEIGLIKEDSNHKTQIFYLIKQAPAEFRKNEASLIVLIERIEASIKAREDRLAALRARTKERMSSV
jgi:hypothetical protein